ncbi:MAG TPA: ABC transporter ATP-binding protein, partial [Vicinamibacterales bacterium]|nr:ABC transporter ATP-binding protein [Vicinamibacterales bacterium]
SPGMYRDLTVDDFLLLVRDLYGSGNIPEVVEAFGLGPFRSRRMAELSGGMQRRLSMAAALVSSPEVLLLDEPTVGLDPVATREVHTFLRKVMPGRTVLLCTHNLAEVERVADRVAVLRSRLIAVGTPSELRQRLFTSRLRIRLSQDAESFAPRLRASGLNDVGADGSWLSLSEGTLTTPQIVRMLVEAGAGIEAVEREEPSLEDVYLKLLQADGAPG